MTQAIPINQKTYEGIRGWLLLPLLGVVISIFLQPYSMYEALLSIFDPEVTDYLMNFRTNYIYSEYIQVLTSLIYSFLYSMLFLVFSTFLLWRFLTKSKTTPKLFVLYLILDVVLTVISIIIVGLSPAIVEELNRQDYIECARDLGSTIVRAAIWIPYSCIREGLKIRL